MSFFSDIFGRLTSKSAKFESSSLDRNINALKKTLKEKEEQKQKLSATNQSLKKNISLNQPLKVAQPNVLQITKDLQNKIDQISAEIKDLKQQIIELKSTNKSPSIFPTFPAPSTPSPSSPSAPSAPSAPAPSPSPSPFAPAPSPSPPSLAPAPSPSATGTGGRRKKYKTKKGKSRKHKSVKRRKHKKN